MDRDVALQILEELSKLRKDMDKAQAYQKTMAEQLEVIAQNTAPEPAPGT